VIIGTFASVFSIVAIYETGTKSFQNGSFMNFLKNDFVFLSVPTTILIFLIGIGGQFIDNWYISEWIYFPIIMIHELLGANLIQRNYYSMYGYLYLRDVLIMFFILQLGILFKIQFFFIPVIIGLRLSYELNKLSDE